ncbi:MAG: ATP-binding cassette domain-containing protein, partial [Solobacterium sp.]|nr:ATP-binding cassette domain-containing protein [Solobacterium sp.]
MSYIEFSDVTKIYHVGEVDIHALSGTTFSIEKGQFVVIAGASGAGKSTILNILGGMDTCTDGEITVDGVRVDQMDENELTDYRRYDIGFVFQFYNLVQNLTAL